VHIDVADKSFMMVFLLEECNFDCRHCVREDEPMAPGYKLSLDQLHACLRDCRAQLHACLRDCRALGGVRQVHFSGGEPTLWREGDLRLVDLLIHIATAGFTPSFTSNGSFFTDFARSQAFLLRYTSASKVPLRLYLSIDTFHRNFDRATGRAPCLDNVLRCRQELPADKGDLLESPIIIVTVSKSTDSLLPEEMITHYESCGVSFRFVPLHGMGKARTLKELCPDLGSDDPTDRGAFQRYLSARRPVETGNDSARIIGEFLILIGDDYFVHAGTGADRGGYGWHRVAALGQLPLSIPPANGATEGSGRPTG